MSTRISDRAEQALAETITADFFHRVCRRVIQDLNDRVRRLLSGVMPGMQSEISAQDATSLLQDCAKLVETHAHLLASSYSPLRWLWTLRRLPAHVFAGKLPTTAGYDMLLAEVLSGRSTRAEDRLRVDAHGVCSYPTAGGFPRRISEFCAAVIYLSELHTRLRWAGKGAVFRIDQYGLPSPVPSEELKGAVRLYDSRTATAALPLERGGTVLAQPVGTSTKESFILRVDPIEPMYRPLPRFSELPPAPIPRDADVEACYRFFPTLLSLTPLHRLSEMARSTQIWSREAFILMVLLWSATILVIRHRAGLLSLVTRGYLLLDLRPVEELFNLIIADFPNFFSDLFPSEPPPDSGASFLEELSALGGESWPLRAGPIVRTESSFTCLDLHAATARLDVALEFSLRGGPTANARAGHFEYAIQDLIDQSEWKPGLDLAALRGKPLRFGGRTITDLDAIGARGETLLLVSCKSVVYSASYDVGEYATVRNAAATVTRAVEEWSRKIAQLEKQPVGDNYNLSGFRHLIPLVITPTVVYVPLGPSTQEVAPGLKAAISFKEFARWLQVPDSWP